MSGTSKSAQELVSQLCHSPNTLETKESTIPQDNLSDHSQETVFLTPRTWSSCTDISLLSSRPNEQGSGSSVIRDGKISSDQKVQSEEKPDLIEDSRSTDLDRNNAISLGTEVPATMRSHQSAPKPSPSLELDGKLHRRRSRLSYQHLAEKRMAAISTRIHVQERRNALRNAREDLVDLDARFSQDLRSLLARTTSAELKDLLIRHEDVQKFRQDVQLQEYEYNSLEDDLNHVEWEMREQESKFYEHQRDMPDRFFLKDGEHSSGVSVYAKSTSNAPSTSSSLSPLKQQWLSRIGDRNLLIEHLEELRDERALLVEKQKVRGQVALLLDEEAQDFLDNFDSRQAALQYDLKYVEADMARLQEALSEQADMRYTADQFEGESESSEHSLMDTKLCVASADGGTGPSRDPLLLLEEPADPVFSNVDIDSKQETINRVSYINHWLLHILRRSAMEVRRFKMTEKLESLQLDPEQLKGLVLEYWSKDGTATQAWSHLTKSAPATSRVIGQDYATRATLSDSVIVSLDRIACRSQGRQPLQLEEDASMSIFTRSSLVHNTRRRTTSSW